MANKFLQQDSTGGFNWVSSETGTGSIVYSNSPTLVTPVLGVATATSINKVTITQPATGATLTIIDGKVFTASNTLTLTGTDGSSVAFGAGGTVVYTGSNLSVFAATTSAQLRGVISDETGGGLAVFNDTPTLITPVLGVATATTLNGLTVSATNGTLTVANGSTLANSGAFALTLTTTAATNVTFPTTGTLATTSQIPSVASQAEVDAGADNAKIVTSLTLATKTSTSWTQFVGISSSINYSAGTWTTTRLGQGNYVKRKTAAADTTIIGIDITAQFRAGGASGFKLVSFDVINRNTTDVLNAHTVILERVIYTDAAAVSAIAMAITGTLPIDVNANPRVTSVTVNTPTFSGDDRYVVEITVNATATAVYDFIGLNLHFSKTL